MKTLNTEEMIKTLECLKSGLHKKWFKNEIEWFDNIIQLLRESEKHKDKICELEEEFEESERELKREIEHWKSKYYNKGV